MEETDSKHVGKLRTFLISSRGQSTRGGPTPCGGWALGYEIRHEECKESVQGRDTQI
jgi:hypothetical protein